MINKSNKESVDYHQPNDESLLKTVSQHSTTKTSSFDNQKDLPELKSIYDPYIYEPNVLSSRCLKKLCFKEKATNKLSKFGKRHLQKF